MTESITLTKEEKIKKEIVENLRQVYDPEISINVYDLGLIYDINMSKLPEVTITHTLTSAFCPAADQIIDDIQQATECINGVDKCMIITTFDPPFTKEMMSEEARMILNI
jgi:metal-sulfur cluster biosynthetic enzyme